MSSLPCDQASAPRRLADGSVWDGWFLVAFVLADVRWPSPSWRGGLSQLGEPVAISTSNRCKTCRSGVQCTIDTAGGRATRLSGTGGPDHYLTVDGPKRRPSGLGLGPRPPGGRPGQRFRLVPTHQLLGLTATAGLARVRNSSLLPCLAPWRE